MSERCAAMVRTQGGKLRRCANRARLPGGWCGKHGGGGRVADEAVAPLPDGERIPLAVQGHDRYVRALIESSGTTWQTAPTAGGPWVACSPPSAIALAPGSRQQLGA